MFDPRPFSSWTRKKLSEKIQIGLVNRDIMQRVSVKADADDFKDILGVYDTYIAVAISDENQACLEKAFGIENLENDWHLSNEYANKLFDIKLCIEADKNTTDNYFL